MRMKRMRMKSMIIKTIENFRGNGKSILVCEANMNRSDSVAFLTMLSKFSNYFAVRLI